MAKHCGSVIFPMALEHYQYNFHRLLFNCFNTSHESWIKSVTIPSQKHWVELLHQNLLCWLLITHIYFPQPLHFFLWHLLPVQPVPLFPQNITNTLLLIFTKEQRGSGSNWDDKFSKQHTNFWLQEKPRSKNLKSHNWSESLRLKWLIHPVRDAAEPRDRTDCKNGLTCTAEEIMSTAVQMISCKCLCICTGERNLTSNQVSIWKSQVAGNC